MSEYGHIYASGTIVDQPYHVDAWGAGPFTITAKDRQYRFEDSDRFGPHLVTKGGAIRSNPWPPEGSPFWRAHKLWREQGRQIADDAVSCIYEWSDPRPTKYFKRGRQLIVLEHGDIDGPIILVPPPDTAA